MTPFKQIRIAILIVIVGLVISGVTAFPLLHELNLLCDLLGKDGIGLAADSDLMRWVFKVRDGLAATYRDYPFIAYGKVGIAASLLVIPLALICGPIRGIPFFWRLIECSFGVLCILPLVFALRMIRQLDGYRA